MTYSTSKIIWLLCTHYLSDFLLQPRAMARGKSEEPAWLAGHLLVTYLCFLWVGPVFSALNAAVHGAVDWYLWRGYKWAAAWRASRAARRAFRPDERDHPAVSQAKLDEAIAKAKGEWRWWEDGMFFDAVGLDQLLHVSTLVVLSGMHYA